jgi:hypothetical protein
VRLLKPLDLKTGHTYLPPYELRSSGAAATLPRERFSPVAHTRNDDGSGYWGAPAAAEDHRTLVAANSKTTAAGSSKHEITRMNQRRTSWSPAPSSVARYRTGPRSASTFRRSPSTDAFSTWMVASALLSRIRGKIGPRLALLIGQGHGRTRAPLVGSGVDRLIDLSDSPIEVSHHARLHREARIGISTAAGDRQVTSERAGDVRLA